MRMSVELQTLFLLSGCSTRAVQGNQTPQRRNQEPQKGNMKEDNYEGIAIHFSDGKKFIWNYLTPLLDLEEFKKIPKIIFLEACRGMMADWASEESAMTASTAFNRQRKFNPCEKVTNLFFSFPNGSFSKSRSA